MKYELRNYQADNKDLTYQRLDEGHRPIVCAPTGSGKTIIAGHIANDSIGQSLRVLFMSGRREILKQTVGVFQDICGYDKVGLLMGDEPYRFYPPVTVASWDTLKARWDRADSWRIPADVVLIDECHLAMSNKMSRTILPYYEDKRVIGFSATPARTSGRGLGSYFTRIIQVRTVQQIIDEGHLAPCEYWAPSCADLTKVRTVRGDYESKGLGQAVNQKWLIGDIVDNWLRLASDRHTIVFATDIAHAQALTERFQALGIAAAVVHSKQTDATRSMVIEQFRERQHQVLVNVGIASYGFDVPSVNCVVLARPTKSVVLHLQMIGRGMRPKDGDFCMVIDHADNVRRLGAAHDRRRWSLDEKKPACTNWERHKENPQRGEAELTECQSCRYMFARSRVCPKCGWEKPAPSRDIETVDGELVKIAKSQREIELESIDRKEWYQMGLGVLRDHGYSNKFLFRTYIEKFGIKPPYNWQFLEPLPPDPRVRNYFRSRAISLAKRREKERREDRTLL